MWGVGGVFPLLVFITDNLKKGSDEHVQTVGYYLYNTHIDSRM